MTTKTKRIAFGVEVVYVDGRPVGRIEKVGNKFYSYVSRTIADKINYLHTAIYGQYDLEDHNQAILDLADVATKSD